MSDGYLELKQGGRDSPQGLRRHRCRRRPQGIADGKTIKATLGKHFEGCNATHQMKKTDPGSLKEFRDTQRIPVSDARLRRESVPAALLPPGSTPRRFVTCSTGAGPSGSRAQDQVQALTLPGRDIYAAEKGSWAPGGGHHRITSDGAHGQSVARPPNASGEDRAQMIPSFPTRPPSGWTPGSKSL